jgi:hypothetical protein
VVESDGGWRYEAVMTIGREHIKMKSVRKQGNFGGNAGRPIEAEKICDVVGQSSQLCNAGVEDGHSEIYKKAPHIPVLSHNLKSPLS